MCAEGMIGRSVLGFCQRRNGMEEGVCLRLESIDGERGGGGGEGEEGMENGIVWLSFERVN